MKAIHLILVLVFLSFMSLFAFGEPQTPHRQFQSKETTSRPQADKEIGFTGFAKGRMVDGKFQYLDNEGNWKEATTFYRADKDGTFLNRVGDSVDFSAGDIIFQTPDFGWFKAKKDTPTVPNPKEVSLSEVEELIVQFTNEERVKRGLPALKVSPRLQELTRQKAQNMAKSQNLSHNISPQTPGGENIAWNQASAKEVVQSWMNSSGHRANILNPRYSEIGVGMAQGNGPYWAQMFQ